MALPAPVAVQRKTIFRRLTSIDSDAFITAVQQSPVGSDNVNLLNQSTADLCSLYNTELCCTLDVMLPPTVISVAERSRHRGLMANVMSAADRALERRYRRSRLDEDRLVWSEGKTGTIAAKERVYWTKKLNDCSGDSKQL